MNDDSITEQSFDSLHDKPISGGARSTRKHFYVALAVIFIIFLLQNLEETTIDFFFWDFRLPKLFMYLFLVFIGAVAGFIGRGHFNH